MVVRYGTPRRLASASDALATSQSWPWIRSGSSRSASAAPAARMWVFMSSTHLTNFVRSFFGNGGSATRCTTTPARTSSVACSRAPRVSTCTSTPARTSPSDSLRTWRPSPPSTIGGYSQLTIRTRGATRGRSLQVASLEQAEAPDVGGAPLLARHDVAPGAAHRQPRGRPLGDRHDRQHLALPAQVRAHAVAGVERLVGPGERLRAARAQGERRA